MKFTLLLIILFSIVSCSSDDNIFTRQGSSENRDVNKGHLGASSHSLISASDLKIANRVINGSGVLGEYFGMPAGGGDAANNPVVFEPGSWTSRRFKALFTTNDTIKIKGASFNNRFLGEKDIRSRGDKKMFVEQGDVDWEIKKPYLRAAVPGERVFEPTWVRTDLDCNIQSAQGPDNVTLNPYSKLYCHCLQKNLNSKACSWLPSNMYTYGDGGRVKIEIVEDQNGLPEGQVIATLKPNQMINGMNVVDSQGTFVPYNLKVATEWDEFPTLKMNQIASTKMIYQNYYHLKITQLDESPSVDFATGVDDESINVKCRTHVKKWSSYIYSEEHIAAAAQCAENGGGGAGTNGQRANGSWILRHLSPLWIDFRSAENSRVRISFL